MRSTFSAAPTQSLNAALRRLTESRLTTTALKDHAHESFFVHIKFLPDGVDIKLTEAGLAVGCTFAGAMVLAKFDKDEHSAKIGRTSAIKVPLLAIQIQLHAVAYVGCSTVDAVPLLGRLTSKPCKNVQRHANPVNVSWPELGVFAGKRACAS